MTAPAINGYEDKRPRHVCRHHQKRMIKMRAVPTLSHECAEITSTTWLPRGQENRVDFRRRHRRADAGLLALATWVRTGSHRMGSKVPRRRLCHRFLGVGFDVA